MAQALYRKYRPTDFASVVGQAHVTTTLLNEIKHEQISHAYLFTGPRGVGKTTVARLVAKAVNRLEPGEATQLDIIEIDAASHTGVDHVREHVIQNAYVSPTKLKYKVFIIDEVHMLSTSAFNALLKILEEPPAHVIFILATTEIHKVPATIISRCQRFDFHPITVPAMIEQLAKICEQEQVQVDQSVLQRIARRAGGALRDAESMLGQVLSLGDTTITAEQADIILPRANLVLVLQLVEQLLLKNPQRYLELLQQATQEGLPVREMQVSLIEVLRQAMLYSIDKKEEHLLELDLDPAKQQPLLEVLKVTSTANYTKLLDIFLAMQTLPDSRIATLPLELAGVEWCIADQLAAAAPVVGPVAPVQPATQLPGVTPFTMPVFKKQSAKQAAPVQAQNLTPNDQLTETVKAKWHEIVAATKTLNHSLAMTLSVAHIVGVFEPNVLQLGMRFDFHKQRLHDSVNRAFIHQAIEQVLEQALVIECIVDAKYEIDMQTVASLPSDNIAAVEAVTEGNIWDLALQTLGSTAEAKPAS